MVLVSPWAILLVAPALVSSRLSSMHCPNRNAKLATALVSALLLCALAVARVQQLQLRCATNINGLILKDSHFGGCLFLCPFSTICIGIAYIVKFIPYLFFSFQYQVYQSIDKEHDNNAYVE